MRKKMTYDIKYTYIFYILLAVTLVWDLIYRDGVKFGRILLIYGTIFAARILFTKTFLKKSKTSYMIALGFIFAAMYLANVCNFYGIPYYDKILHLASGALLGYIGLIIYIYFFGGLNNKTNKAMASIVFVFIFAVASAGIWEVWEFATDQLLNLTAQNGLIDTMWDIICGTIGGIAFCSLIFINIKTKKVSLINRVMKEME